MPAILFHPGFRVTDSNGKPVSGAKIYIYTAGTTTPLTTYQNLGLSVAHANPIVCNTGGMPANSSNAIKLVYYGGGANVKVRVETSASVLIWEFDDYPPYVSDSGTVPVATGGTGATTAAGARTNLAVASQADLNSLTTTVSAIDTQLDGIGGDLGAVASLDSIGITNLASGFSEIIIQRVRVTDATKTSITGATVPQDTTVPQSSEGTQVFSQSFTPQKTTSTIRVTVQITLEYAAAREAIVTLFTSASANAIAAANAACVINQPQTIWFQHEFASPGTSAITISVRVGADSTTAPTLNGVNFNSVPISFLLIQEFQATPIV